MINYNGARVLPHALAAACALRDRFTEMLVLDNGSTDGSADEVERDFPPFRVRRLGANLGAGGARNVGLREATADLILFMDNDVELTAECVDELVRALAAHPRAALAAASIVYAHRRDTVQYDGAECHYLGHQIMLNEDRPVAGVDPAIRSIGSLSTCCFMVDRLRLPGDVTFDESFFYMFEDHDFGLRVRAHGAEIIAVPTAHCYHGAGTEGLSIRQLGTYSKRRVYYLIRNRWLVVLKNYSWRTLLVLAPMFALYECAQLAIAARKGWLGEWGRAAAWIARNRAAICQSRRAARQARRVPDRQLLHGGAIPFRSELTTGAVERLARRLLDRLVIAYWTLARPLI